MATQALIQGYLLGSLSMTSYSVGAAPGVPGEAAGAADLPEGVPPEQTNI